jgi:exonuclease VII small subunit
MAMRKQSQIHKTLDELVDKVKRLEAQNQELVDALAQWANAERSGDQAELENARISRNVLLAMTEEME